MSGDSGGQPKLADKYTKQGVEPRDVAETTTFANTGATYSGYYGSGIEQGSLIKITLDKAATGDAPIQ